MINYLYADTYDVYNIYNIYCKYTYYAYICIYIYVDIYKTYILKSNYIWIGKILFQKMVVAKCIKSPYISIPVAYTLRAIFNLLYLLLILGSLKGNSMIKLFLDISTKALTNRLYYQLIHLAVLKFQWYCMKDLVFRINLLRIVNIFC